MQLDFRDVVFFSFYSRKLLFSQVKDEYSLVLTLTDGHLGEGNFITQSLLLLVEDVNDNEPIFKPYQPTISIREDSAPYILTTVEATDQDEGPYGQVNICFIIIDEVTFRDLLS
jgi:hypothetical protein